MLKKKGVLGTFPFARQAAWPQNQPPLFFLLLALGAVHFNFSWRMELRHSSEQLLPVFFVDLLTRLLPDRRVACSGIGEQQCGSAASHQT